MDPGNEKLLLITSSVFYSEIKGSKRRAGRALGGFPVSSQKIHGTINAGHRGDGLLKEVLYDLLVMNRICV